MNPITTYPMARAVASSAPPAAPAPRWRPTPYGQGSSPFTMGRSRPRRMGQIFGSQSLFDHPLMGLAVDAGAIGVSAIGITQFKGPWKTVAWAVLVASSIKAVNDLVRLMTMPGPAPTQP